VQSCRQKGKKRKAQNGELHRKGGKNITEQKAGNFTLGKRNNPA